MKKPELPPDLVANLKAELFAAEGEVLKTKAVFAFAIKARRSAVQRARDEGMTWDAIAGIMGIKRPTAVAILQGEPGSVRKYHVNRKKHAAKLRGEAGPASIWSQRSS